MPALALFLDKCQYMDYLSAGLQHSALHVSNICPCRNYTRTVLVYCDIHTISSVKNQQINPLNPELNPICYLLALLGAHDFLHVSRIRVKSLTLRRLMSYIYEAPILDVSRSHTTTQHSR